MTDCATATGRPPHLRVRIGEPQAPIINLDDIRVIVQDAHRLHPAPEQGAGRRAGSRSNSCRDRRWASWANRAAASPPRPTS